MSGGIAAMWDDAEHYEWLAEYYDEKTRVTPGGMWPYNFDSDHYDSLVKRYREEKK
jgi:hypothetical protein